MEQGQNINALFAAADAAVYLAKNEGRNQVRSHTPMRVQAGDLPGCAFNMMQDLDDQASSGGVLKNA